MNEQIAGALNRVMLAVSYVQKTGRTTFGEKFSYAAEADLIAGARSAMVAEGLCLFPTQQSVNTEEHGPTKAGQMQFRCTTVVTWILLHLSGESLTVQTVGVGVDVGDKGAYKAQTGALKYALRQLLMLETGDDPDVQPSSAQAVEKKTLKTSDGNAAYVATTEFAAVVNRAGLGMEEFRDWLRLKKIDMPTTDEKRASMVAWLADGGGAKVQRDLIAAVRSHGE